MWKREGPWVELSLPLGVCYISIITLAITLKRSNQILTYDNNKQTAQILQIHCFCRNITKKWPDFIETFPMQGEIQGFGVGTLSIGWNSYYQLQQRFYCGRKTTNRFKSKSNFHEHASKEKGKTFSLFKKRL